MKICVASGKGGTGKTTVAVNLARSLDENIILLDCDVEEPNTNLFLKGEPIDTEICYVKVPKVDESLCDGCRKCTEICEFKAIIVIEKVPMLFYDLCHSCGGCYHVCPQHAISEIDRRIGVVESYKRKNVLLYQGRIDIGVAMAPPLIKQVKKHINDNKVCILDAPPGTSCPAIATMQGSDFIILVTEPTPFGLNDLKLAVEVTRKLNIPFGVVINRSDIGDNRVHEYLKQENIPLLMEIKHDIEIAKLYSEGKIIVEEIRQYKDEFKELKEKVVEIATQKNYVET